MPLRTQLLQILPWSGGLNTSDDPALLSEDEFTIIQNVEITKRNTRLKRDGINNNWDDSASSTNTIIAMRDFWYESSDAKTNTLVAISTSGSVYSYDSGGARVDITGGSTWTTPSSP